MIVDSAAVIAVFKEEPGAERFLRELCGPAEYKLMSAPQLS